MSFSSMSNHKFSYSESDKAILSYIVEVISELQRSIQDERFRMVFDLLDDARIKTLQVAEGPADWGTTTSLPMS